MTSGDTIIRTSGLDLFILDSAVSQPLILITSLQRTAASTTAIIIGSIGIHVDEIFFTNHRSYNIPQIFRDRITEGFTHDLTWILNGKLDFKILVPIAVNLQFPFPYPFCIVFINIFNFKVMRNVEFFQSCQDRVSYVASFSIEKDLTPQFFGLLG
jgi:hypothetical protein